MKPKQLMLAGFLGISAIAFQAHAGTVCVSPPDLPAVLIGILPNAGCEIGGANNDTLGAPPIQVNSDLMFGFDDWVFAQKVFDSDEDFDIGLQVCSATFQSANSVWHWDAWRASGRRS